MTSTLVVDDESDIRLMVRLLLESSGDYIVLAEATDGREAVEKARELAPGDPDLIILDNRMPKLTGLDAAREILAVDPTRTIVLFSAFLDDQVRREAAEIGIAAVVSKTDLHDLPRRLRELLP